MSPAKSNKITKAVLYFTAIFRWQMIAGENCAKNRGLKIKDGDKPSQILKFIKVGGCCVNTFPFEFVVLSAQRVNRT